MRTAETNDCDSGLVIRTAETNECDPGLVTTSYIGKSILLQLVFQPFISAARLQTFFKDISAKEATGNKMRLIEQNHGTNRAINFNRDFIPHHDFSIRFPELVKFFRELKYKATFCIATLRGHPSFFKYIYIYISVTRNST
jgi:hypothetical protein